ncbi:MAG TPA: hypothetical protein VEL76_33460, partial [Gemmataceae bacterium]|nr:hypothetical protein [Gemmataceae bacterium]
MAESTDPQFVRTWREEPQPPLEPGRLRPGIRRTIYLVVLGMLILGGTFAGMLFWISPAPNPAFVPLFVTQYRPQQIALPANARNDREALQQGRFFPRWRSPGPAFTDRYLLARDLLGLRQLESHETVVVHLTAQALRDDKGNVVVLPADADPDHLQSGLPLRDILQALRDCPAQHKLLILDIMRPFTDPRLGALTDDIAAGAAAEVQALDDPSLLVLCACAPGQVSLASEAMGRSVFSFYLEEGLRGWADGYGEGKRDGHISARELAAFVRARVDRWAVSNRETRQTPLLLGTAPDFLLRAYDENKSPGHVEEVAVEKYPKSLLTAWQKRDQMDRDGTYRLAPHLARRAEGLLLRAEEAWRGGLGMATIEAEYLPAFERVLGDIAKAKAMPSPEPQSLALAAALGQQPDPAFEKALTELLTKLKTQPADLKAEDAAKQRVALINEFATKTESLPPFVRARPVFDLATAETNPAPERLLALEGMVRQRTETPPHFTETLLLRRLAELAAQKDAAPWPIEAVRQLLGVTQRGEQAASHPRAFAWNAVLLEQAAQARHEGEVLFWARGYAPLAEAERRLKKADEVYQAAESRAGILEAALDTFEDALALLPPYAPYLEAVPQNVKPWDDAVRTACDLYDLLHPTAAVDDLTRVTRLKDFTEELKRHLGVLRQSFAADRVAQLQRLSRLPRPEVKVLREIDAVLATPFPRGEERAALADAGRELERRLHGSAVERDRDDDLLRRLTAPPPEFDSAAAAREERVRAERRAVVSRALLELGGVVRGGQPDALSKALDRARQDKEMTGWYALGDALRRAWTQQLSERLQAETSLPALDRLSRIVPPFDRVPALEGREKTPAVQLRLGERAALLAWLADGYRYQAREYRSARLDASLTSASDFYERAARIYGASGPQNYVE